MELNPGADIMDYINLSIQEKLDQELPQTFIPGFHDIEDVKKMLYRPLGQTGLRVSNLSLGTAQFGNCREREEEREIVKTVHAAIKGGINYIDTAPYYSEGKAEIVLGKALKRIPRQSYYLATKVGRYTYNYLTMFDFSTKGVLEKFEESLNRLDVSYVDVIQVHDIEFAPSVGVILQETLPALRRLKAEGKVRFIGITGYPLFKLHELLECSPMKIDTVLSYCHFTFFDTSLESYIPYFKRKGVGIINAGALGMSLLTSNRLPGWHPAHKLLVERCRMALEHCEKKEKDISRLAVGFTLGHRHIETTIIGMTTLKELKKNMEVAHTPLQEDDWDVIHDVKNEIFHNKHMQHDGVSLRNWEGVELKDYWSAVAANQKKKK